MLDKPVLEVIKDNYAKIFSAEKKVADFVLEHPQEAVDANVSELAKASGVSDATVVRMCHHLGYKGYYQFRLMLAKDVGREEGEEIEELQNTPNPVMKIFQKYVNSLTAIAECIDEEDMRSCVNLIKECRQAHVLAVGNTMPLALYMGFRLGRLGVKCTYGISPEYFLNHVNLADKEDIIIAISQSGSSRQIIQGMELAREKGLKMMAITGYRQSPVSELADYVLISNGRKESFDYYKNYAHLKETALIDALLELLTNWKKIEETDADKPEVILSEYKY
ncbi:transcriptional regulator, RpiR family [[Clostridium] saccharolyticum WM1]|uniref:Transcriptional regulator, RpiR family n=2 Tax=Lacrimispora TaxID=2719231 RepID=D9R4Q3_LACSW|nr:MurR/RpiR family transcriptional regulator [Lacrimispora saccharolytica]ADL03237.1 transcriptional regulator, RpiR family [[Clostridium] saccharolyticum WM1]QRV22145.1 MurR/RpiR family transcriptional regulator [Lacrimispora saccharolytica]